MQWKEGGLSSKRFCKERNIILSNFYRWQKLLSLETRKPAAFVSSSFSVTPLPSLSGVVPLAVGSLRLQVSADGLGAALTKLKQAGVIDA
ncbi:IS66 family insertion sequence element accessory protein TnpA [Gilvimarinus gilvus]|uniref:IS66 family insertion sequence element accessory protein TnpA n=1 Tax=Gilvimarinus gilvus TaxID=3058038 RepID=UPI003F8B39DA